MFVSCVLFQSAVMEALSALMKRQGKITVHYARKYFSCETNGRHRIVVLCSKTYGPLNSADGLFCTYLRCVNIL